MDLVTDMATYVRMGMRPKNLGLPYFFLSLYQILLICLSPEIQKFTYSGISRDECEEMFCSSTLGESRIYAPRLT